ncbi:MAG: hypothetical protein J5822_09650 [Eubacteriaceae bacterium]|nr:hypothetical protein [Eubacteriaceae bacterium]
MKKKVFAVLIIVMMLLSVIPGAAFADDPLPDPPVEWFTMENIQAAGISDAGFAEAVYRTIAVDTGIDWANVSGADAVAKVKSVLGSYDKPIDAKNYEIKSMAGVNLLPNSNIALDYNSIEDATPLGSVTARNVAITANFNPIHKWPSVLPRITGTDASSGTYAFEQDFRSKGEAVYLDDGVDKTQQIIFDVYVDGQPKWDLDADEYGVLPTYAAPEGAASLDSTLATGMSSVTFKVTGPYGEDGKASKSYIIAAPPEWVYYASSPRPQSFWPSYVYEINTKYYYSLKVNTTATSVGGFYLLKVKDWSEVSDNPDAETQTPVANAHYALYTDEACTTSAGTAYEDIVTGATPVLVDNLPSGTYWLKETVAAPGYNLNPTPVKVVIADASAAVTLTGTKSVSVTPDSTTWKNDWLSSPDDLKKLDLVCQQEKVTKNAGTNEVYFGGGLDAPNITTPDGFTVATVKVGDESYSTVSAALSDVLAGNESATIAITGQFKQTADIEKDLITVSDKPVTIWVENTTGDVYGTPDFGKNQGGEVYICSRTTFDDPEASEVAGTRSNISSDGADNNSKNRKENFCACGKAADGWLVAVDKIKIGVRDSRDNNGAYYVSLEKGTQTVTITDPHTLETYEIEVTVDWNDEMTQACVFVNPQTFPVDIDVAIPFYHEAQPAPVPTTGVAATMLAWVMIGLAMVYAIIAVRKARKNA